MRFEDKEGKRKNRIDGRKNGSGRRKLGSKRKKPDAEGEEGELR